MSVPSFLITIDTEGDNLWSAPRAITTRNTAFLPRFQALCDRHGLKPTWLVNHEMASDPAFVDFARDVLARDRGEVGMHLHAWNSPPIVPLTADDHRHQPFLTDYPPAVLRAKVTAMTRRLEDTFGIPVISHRAGRWAFNALYARTLVDHGYRVDCSVTPHVDWRGHPGDPAGAGGPDYRRFPSEPYFIDLDDIARSGRSPLLEIPMTVTSERPAPVRRLLAGPLGNVPGVEKAARGLWRNRWLRPNGRNRDAMIAQVEAAAARRAPCVEFMLHSSEFMPGGSPTFPDENAVERLYDDLEALFARAATLCRGATLADFRAAFDVAAAA